MTKIKMLNDRIIFDGHADSRQECETITLMCDNLDKSKDFKTVRYESGYAEFEKVGKTEELKFVSEPMNCTIKFDSHVTKVEVTNEYDETYTWTTSGQTFLINGNSPTTYIFTVTLENGFEINTVQATEAEQYEILSFSNNQITAKTYSSGIGSGFTITTKDVATGLKQVIDVSELPGWVALATGNHQITIKTKASGYVDSAASNAVTVSKAAVSPYTITTVLTNCTGASNNPTTIATGERVTLNFTANDGYGMKSLKVVGAETGDTIWFDKTLKVPIYNPTSNVTITVGAVVQLESPQNVTINGTTLSWNEVTNASGYYIYANGSDIGYADADGSTASKSVDLTTLYGWDDLSDGTYSITVKAQAAGSSEYANSNQSSAVSVTKVSAGYKVYISGSQDTTMGGYAYYSTDNGATWKDLGGGYSWSATNELVGTFTQIKFKIEADAHKLMPYCDLSSTELGLSLSASNGETQISDNYELTKDITDLTFTAVGP